MNLSRIELLPFENDAISSTMWALVGMGKFPDGDCSCAVRRSEDVFVVTCFVTIDLESEGSITISGHSVIKRFLTPNGYGILTESCSEWAIKLPDSGTWCHMTRDEGCFVTRKYSVDGCVVPGMCQFRSQLRQSPSEFAGQHPKLKPCMLREIVVPSFQRLVKSRHQFVENALFDAIRA